MSGFQCLSPSPFLSSSIFDTLYLSFLSASLPHSPPLSFPIPLSLAIPRFLSTFSLIHRPISALHFFHFHDQPLFVSSSLPIFLSLSHPLSHAVDWYLILIKMSSSLSLTPTLFFSPGPTELWSASSVKTGP